MLNFKKLLKVVLVAFVLFTSMPTDYLHALEDGHDHNHTTEEGGTTDTSNEELLNISLDDESDGANISTLAVEGAFKVGSNYYDTLTSAITAAGNSGVIVLNEDYTLPAGTYTIPSGVTLLIPFDSAHTLYTNVPGHDSSAGNNSDWVEPTAYRTLTMADGANIIVNGAISLSAKHHAGGAAGWTENGFANSSAGAPTGPVSFINMNKGSKITLNNGSKLYAWGYITGKGDVIAKSGSEVFENFIIGDFRGGNNTLDMAGDSRGVFVTNQYYVQNIEVYLTLEAGAKETSFTSLYMANQPISSTVLFIAKENSMFNITSGTVTKYYNGTRDRLMVESNGALSINPIEMGLDATTIDSKNFVLPITSNITLEAQTGSFSLNQDVAFLPGVEVNVGSGVTCTIASGTNVYIYDLSEWGGYVSTANVKVIPIAYAPSEAYIRTEADLKDAEFSLAGNLNTSLGAVYTTESGAAIKGVEGAKVYLGTPGTKQYTYQAKYVVEDNLPRSDYIPIYVTPVQLLNADGTYFETALDTDNDGKYDKAVTTNAVTYKNGKWQCAHTYSSVVTLNPTCTVAGVTTYTCSGCNHVYTEAIEALGHTINKDTYKAGVDATCTTAGNTVFEECTVCDYESEYKVIDALGHNYKEVIEYAPTCYQSGMAHEECTRCYDEKASYVVNPTGEHVASKVATIENKVDATCYALGSYDEVFYCTTAGCGEVVKKTVQTIEKLAHTPSKAVQENVVNSSCFAEGSYDEVVYCSVCAAQNIKAEISRTKKAIDKLPHTEVIDSAKAPTCTATGLTEGKHCLVCGEVTVAQTVVDAKGHTEKVIEAVAPTCTASGLTEGKVCTVCNTVTVAQTVDPAKGHTEEVIPAVEATCQKTGLTAGVKCSVCDKVLVAQEVTNKVDHSWDNGVAVEGDEPSCTGDGKLTYSCTSEGCNATKTVTVAALGHSPKVLPAVAATCTQSGLTEGSQCETCLTYITRQVEIPATGHTPMSAVQENVVAASCHAEGSYDEVVYCSNTNCDVTNKEISRTTKVIGKVAHTPAAAVKEDETLPDCTKSGGYYSVVYCSVPECGQRISKVYVFAEALGHTAGDEATCTTAQTCTTCHATLVAALGHDYVGEVITEAGCETAGEALYTCSRCYDSYSDVTPAKGHDYLTLDEDVKAPTCTEPGDSSYYFCQNCPSEVEGQLPALGHDYQTVAGHNSTCYATGLTEGSQCTRCLDWEVEQTVIDKKDHVWSSGYYAVVTDRPSCTEEGTLTYECTNDGCTETKTEKEAALGHDETVITGYDSTCTQTGLTDGVYCNKCNSWVEEQTVIGLKDHTESVLPAVDATCTETGLAAGVECSVCHKVLTEQEETPKLPHDWEAKDITGHPSCEGTGTQHMECSVCGADDYVEISALGHDYQTVEGYDSTCYATGLTDGSQCSRCAKWEEEQTVIEKKDHTPGTAVKEDFVDSSCYAEGSYNDVVYCSVCAAQNLVVELSSTPQVVIKKAHTAGSAVQENFVDSTCYAEGSYDDVVYCSVCAEHGYKEELSRTGQVVIKKAHTAGTAVTENVVGATCYAEGSYDSVVYCAVCAEEDIKEELSRTSLPIEMVDHTAGVPEYENVVGSTCSTEGSYDEVVYCSKCASQNIKKELSRTEKVIEKKAHTERVMPAVEADCDDTGLTEGKDCSVCNEVLVPQQVINAKGHKEVIDLAVEAKCEETGLTEGKHCSVCNEVLVPQTKVDALGHTERVIPAVEAKCEETGLTEGQDCSVCKKVLIPQEVVEATGHKLLPGALVTAAKCDMTGLEIAKCELCLQDQEVIIPELGHVLETVPAKKPTYTEAGWDTYEKCTRIDCAYNTMVGIPALGEATIESFDEFVENLAILEDIADTYVKKVSPGKDPISLVIKYIRTGVERYNSGSWNIMAGYEDTDFANYVKQYESDYNKALADGEEMMKVTGMKNLEEFKLPNGNDGDLGHVIGSMDISYTNKTSQNHIDVSGFFGDSVDLLSAADQYGITSTTVEAMVKEIEDKYFLKTSDELWEIYKEEPVEGSFSDTDIQGDLDSYYLFNELMKREYENGTLAKLFSGYMTKKLTDEQRATYFIKNRLDGVTLRTELRDKVFEEYTSNAMVATLESSRDFNSDAAKLNNLRRAVTNVVADWLCERAGDYIDLSGNPYISVVESNTVILAPGISQTIKKADTADGKQMDYYIATMDVNREDVDVRTNYKNNDPMDRKWQMTRVLDQANAAQNRHSNPEDTKNYIENFNVVAAINGTGFDMATGEPSDLLMMEGIVVHDTGSDDFFGIKTDGTAVIGTRAEFNELKAKGEIREAISSFGTRLVEDGKIKITGTGDYFSDRASRTAIGITKTGKVVFLVIDGRQGVLSCGASAIEIAQIMLDAGCYQALNLDGGGSSTYVAKLPGTDALDVVSFPSDGVARSVASSLYAVSTAPSSTAFDHAVLDADHTYLTVGSTAQLTARAVSATGNAVDMPEGTVWSVSNKAFGEITQEGVFTAKKNGEVTVNLTLDGEVIGSKKMFVVVPDKVYFEKQSINAIYGIPVRLPVKAVYEGKVVAINESDVVLSLPNAAVGTLDGFMFTADEKSGLRKTTAEAALVVDESVKATLNIALFTQDEASFDFDNATGGDYQFAFDREVSNATTSDNSVYYAIDRNKDMVTEYTFAIDMSKIDIPAQLKDLTYMLPGSDLETASAWNYLLQLAERVSALTTVQPVLTFDKDVKVDISEITVSNEYFKLEGTDFDEEKNELTLHLRWIKQSKPIDPATANPLCILSGIKITPKANVNWGSSETLNIKNVGTIGYDIYLRTNALYSFSQKPENQKTFGLYPFENLLTDPVERGGHFTSVYKEFEDEYTLSKAIKEGWVMESGGWAYYEDGAKYTGIKEVDGLYYDFGETGINVGQKPYTGDFFDNGKEYFVNEGKFYIGWRIVSMKDVRYYDEKGVREILDRKEIPSTCIEDGECTYTRSNGEVKKIEYDDAGGHEYVKQANGDYKCSVCGHVRIEMSEVTVTLSANLFTYTGGVRQPGTTAVTKDGYVLKKVPAAYPDYASTYKNNVNVGTGTVTLTAQRYGVYVNMTEWRGNAKGSITLEYEIRPDLPTSINLVENGNNVVLSWNAVKAEYLLKDNDANTDLVYVIYKVNADGTTTEIATTKDLTKTLTGAEYKGAQFKIGTRATVKGKTYESISLSDGIATKLYVTTAVTEAGKPKLTWNDVPNGVSYEILRANSKNGKYAQVYTTENNSYTHTSAEAGNTYYYKVRVVFKDGTKLTSDIVSCTAKAPEQPKPENPTTPTVSGVTRVFGASRYETAFKTADTLKTTLGVSKFETAIVANGTNFADALAGSYLAAKKSAPILMTDKNAKNITNLVNYIKANVQPGGTVYILGGYAALPNTIDKGLAGYTVKRLAGKDRYETNLMILDAAGVTNEAILVATGTGFADSLSASATGLPILLVNKNLNKDQKAFLEAHKANAKYIIGGTSAVSATVEKEVSVYGKPKCLAGALRYNTSVMVAEEFFKNPTNAVVAYGRNFPDGLSGGPLAYAIGAPLLLAENSSVKTIDAYTEQVGITNGYVLGGSGLVSDASVKTIYNAKTIK